MYNVHGVQIVVLQTADMFKVALTESHFSTYGTPFSVANANSSLSPAPFLPPKKKNARRQQIKSPFLLQNVI
jgi:hypothetical protein